MYKQLQISVTIPVS